ncbi:MAG: hypothetical protein QM652_07230 [Legionella sp.]|uniref:hypothetical protein n=1 Tax=Legionella sp. TaxID=459 RepID=UPI0039E6F579
MFTSLKIAFLQEKFIECSKKNYRLESKNFFHAGAQLLELLMSTNLSDNKKNEERDIICIGTLAIVHICDGNEEFISEWNNPFQQDCLKCWNDFKCYIEQAYPDVSSFKLPLDNNIGIATKHAMILNMGAQILNEQRRCFDKLIESTRPFSDELLEAHKRKNNQPKNYKYKSVYIERQQDYAAIESIFENVLKLFKLNTGGKKKEFCKLIEELKDNTLRDFIYHEKMFHLENCKLIANETLLLATAVASGTVEQRHLSQFSQKLNKFSSCKWFEVIAYTIITLAMATMAAAVGGVTGGIPGSVIGASAGALAGYRLTMWAHLSMHPITKIAQSAYDAQVDCVGDWSPS